MREGPRGFVHLLGLPLRALALGLIGAYRLVLSPVFGGRCRFHPSCSEYAQEAIRRHGALKGLALAAWRVLRCSPLSAGGPDPVPPARATRRTEYDAVTPREV